MESGHFDGDFLSSIPSSIRGYMTRTEFRRKLVQDGVDLSSRDVFHIIKACHGGVDHVDNYIVGPTKINRLLGGLDDISTPISCFLAGKAKAIKAVQISVMTAQLVDQHGFDQKVELATGHLKEIGTFIRNRDCSYTQGPLKDMTGDAAFAVGGALFQRVYASGASDLEECIRLLRRKRKHDEGTSTSSEVLAATLSTEELRKWVARLLDEVQLKDEKIVQLENEIAELRKELSREGSLLRMAQERVKQLDDGIGIVKPTDKHTLKKIEGYMSKETFKKRLVELGLITLQPGAKEEGQHVFHIIASSNGGPDHTDNYLYALGGTFNMTIADKFDHLNCYLAGKEKARLAVDIATKTARDPALHTHIDKRKKPKPVLFTEGPHKHKSGDQLFADGQNLFTRSVLAAGRADRKAGQ